MMNEWITTLWNGLKQVGGWCKSVPSEPNGTGSASRVALLMLTGTVCWLLYAYYHYHGTLPEESTLLGIAACLTAVAGAYGVNKWTCKNDSGDGGDKG